jgi:hypothetical protein
MPYLAVVLNAHTDNRRGSEEVRGSGCGTDPEGPHAVPVRALNVCGCTPPGHDFRGLPEWENSGMIMVQECEAMLGSGRSR